MRALVEQGVPSLALPDEEVLRDGLLVLLGEDDSVHEPLLNDAGDAAVDLGQLPLLQVKERFGVLHGIEGLVDVPAAALGALGDCQKELIAPEHEAVDELFLRLGLG